jgi:hypothetical protein
VRAPERAGRRRCGAVQYREDTAIGSLAGKVSLRASSSSASSSIRGGSLGAGRRTGAPPPLGLDAGGFFLTGAG